MAHLVILGQRFDGFQEHIDTSATNFFVYVWNVAIKRRAF